MTQRKAEKPAAMRRWRLSRLSRLSRFAGWSGFGLATIALTAALMGQWPTLTGKPTRTAIETAPQADLSTVSAVSYLSPPASNRRGLKATSLPGPALSAHTGIDVLARLETAGRNRPPVQPDTNLSNTLDEALQRALSFPDFSALAGRTDAEGRFEAAAWADACERAALPAQEMPLRCRESARHGPNYADELLRQAADAGQPGAVLSLASRHPEQWLEIPLRSGDLLGDRVFTLAALGRSGALALLSQWCAVPGACVDGALTRNVLALLQLSIYKTGTADASEYLTGSETNRREAVDRAARLRTQLQWPD